MPLRLLALLLALLPAAATAQPVPPRPKLLLVISVDQFSADLFAEYRARFAGGLRRLADGAVFPAGYQSHGATETCPGHSTILTGARPARTGIIANMWADPTLERADKMVYCAEDPTVPGSTSTRYTPSLRHLRVPTLGDRMKAANPASRVVAVAGKDRAALMMGGNGADQLWWIGERGFRTLDGRPPHPAIPAADARVDALLARPPRVAIPAWCAAHAREIAVGRRRVGAVAAAKPGDMRDFRASPAYDTAVADTALALAADLRLGRGPATDLLIVGLSATDYVGHTYGTQGAEMCAQLAALDATIGRLLAAMDATGVPYAVALTADHGGHDIPEREIDHAEPGIVRMDADLLPDAVDRALRAEFRLDRRIIWGEDGFGDIYLSGGLPEAQRQRILRWLRARYLAHPQVEAVFTREELARPGDHTLPPDEWSLIDRVRASHDSARSGDLYLVLRPNVASKSAAAGQYISGHGTPWNPDRRVPILFWRPGMTGFEQPRAVETVDIMPTLAALIGLRVPADEVDGRCLDLDEGPRSTCPPAG